MLDPALLDGGNDGIIRQISGGFSSSDFENFDVFIGIGGDRNDTIENH